MSMNSFHARVVTHVGTRADALLVQRGLAPSRTAAQRLIDAGRVSLDGEMIFKPAQLLPENAALEVAPAPDAEYVSRGGLKLAGALQHAAIDVAGRDWFESSVTGTDGNREFFLHARHEPT